MSYSKKFPFLLIGNKFLQELTLENFFFFDFTGKCLLTKVTQELILAKIISINKVDRN